MHGMKSCSTNKTPMKQAEYSHVRKHLRVIVTVMDIQNVDRRQLIVDYPKHAHGGSLVRVCWARSQKPHGNSHRTPHA